MTGGQVAWFCPLSPVTCTLSPLPQVNSLADLLRLRQG